MQQGVATNAALRGVLEIMQHPCQRLSDPLCHSYMRNTTAVYIASGEPLVRIILLPPINFNNFDHRYTYQLLTDHEPKANMLATGIFFVGKEQDQ